MKIPFVKLHGAKNDFLLTMAEDMPLADLQEVAIAICNRYTGVGADGWMLLDRTGGTPGYDASIRLFNSDGSEPEISGNGTRCAAALLAMAHAERTTSVSAPARVSSNSGFLAGTSANSTSK